MIGSKAISRQPLSRKQTALCLGKPRYVPLSTEEFPHGTNLHPTWNSPHSPPFLPPVLTRSPYRLRPAGNATCYPVLTLITFSLRGPSAVTSTSSSTLSIKPTTSPTEKFVEGTNHLGTPYLRQNQPTGRNESGPCKL